MRQRVVNKEELIRGFTGDIKEVDIYSECRICLDRNPEQDLIAPCKCKGSCKYVHKQCLLKEFSYSDRKELYSQNPKYCNICSTQYSLKNIAPSFMRYVEFRWNQFSVQNILIVMKNIFQHLKQPCDHALMCWIVKFLILIAFASLSLFVGRLELYLLNLTDEKISWREFLESFSRFFDNALVLVCSFLLHSLLIMISIYSIRIVLLNRLLRQQAQYSPIDLQTRRKLLKELKTLVGFTLLTVSYVAALMESQKT